MTTRTPVCVVAEMKSGERYACASTMVVEPQLTKVLPSMATCSRAVRPIRSPQAGKFTTTLLAMRALRKVTVAEESQPIATDSR